MRFILLIASILAAVQFVFTPVLPALAETNPAAESAALLGKTGLGPADVGAAGSTLPIVVGNIIRVFLSLLGIIFVVLIVYAGFLWMTAAGESEKVDKAKGIIKSAIIGLIITVMAYAITSYVIVAVLSSTTYVGP